MTARQAARSKGLKTYQGRPCRHGHTERYVQDRQCVLCGIVRRRTPHARKRQRTWRQDNFERERKRKRTWEQDNAVRCAAHAGKKRVVKEYGMVRIPADFDFEATISFYEQAQRLTRETGIRHEVDHIEPLMLGGLHESANLQVLTRTVNLAKHKSDRRSAEL